MKLYIGSDHRGVILEENLIKELSKKYQIFKSAILNDSNDDYPDFAFDVCQKVGFEDYGILICGNGIGISIAANKVKGIRCARCVNVDDAKQAKEHNQANVISIPANLDINDALNMIETFINTTYSMDERHIRRVDKIKEYEQEVYK